MTSGFEKGGEGISGLEFVDIGRFGVNLSLVNNLINLSHFSNDDSGASFPMNISLLSSNSF